jgi:hypothetical protein
MRIFKTDRLKWEMVIAGILLIFSLALNTSCIPAEDRDLDDENYDVYKPEVLDDGKPDVEGTFWEIANNPDISVKQKVLIEAFVNWHPILIGANLGASDPIEGLGITDLNALKGVYEFEPTPQNYILKIFSSRLNDISALKEFVHLDELVIRGSDITDLTPISNLINLTTLDISYSKAIDLSALSGLINLKTLTIDKESNFSLEPIKHLIKGHLNSNNKMINLNVVYIENKLKEAPTTIGRNSTKGKITPTLQGKFKLIRLAYNLKSSSNLFLRGESDSVGELIFKGNEFKFSVTEKLDDIPSFTWSGTYRSVGNLIYFKQENGTEYINSFDWSEGLTFNLIDRTNFENTTVVKFEFRKVSDNPE